MVGRDGACSQQRARARVGGAACHRVALAASLLYLVCTPQRPAIVQCSSQRISTAHVCSCLHHNTAGSPGGHLSVCKGWAACGQLSTRNGALGLWLGCLEPQVGCMHTAIKALSHRHQCLAAARAEPAVWSTVKFDQRCGCALHACVCVPMCQCGGSCLIWALSVCDCVLVTCVRVCAHAAPRSSVQHAALLCVHVCALALGCLCGACLVPVACVRVRLCVCAYMSLCTCVRALRRATAGHMPSKSDPETYDEVQAKPSSSCRRATAKRVRVGVRPSWEAKMNLKNWSYVSEHLLQRGVPTTGSPLPQAKVAKWVPQGITLQPPHRFPT